MSLGSLLRQAADEVGITRPSVNAPQAVDTGTQQMVALLKRAGEDLISKFEWSALITGGTLTTVAHQAAYAVPADFDRFVDETQWQSSSRVPLYGPLNQQDWARNEFGAVTVGPYYRQQLRGNSLYLQPTPSAAGQTVAFYYISSNWIQQSGDPTQPSTSFAADADTFLLPEALLLASVKWRLLRAKRLSYDEERDEFDRLLVSAQAQDRGARTLSMDPQGAREGRFGFVIPITGFGA